MGRCGLLLVAPAGQGATPAEVQLNCAPMSPPCGELAAVGAPTLAGDERDVGSPPALFRQWRCPLAPDRREVDDHPVPDSPGLVGCQRNH